jgi:propionate CoA-transferase
LYITERAVFRRMEKGLELIEIAPGIHLERDILAHMEFTPVISSELKVMDPRLFQEPTMGLTVDLSHKEPCNIPERLKNRS